MIEVDAAEMMVLPNPLQTETGEPVTSISAWCIRRQEILELFRTHVYGRTPKEADAAEVQATVTEEDHHALGGAAIRRQVTLSVETAKGKLAVDILSYLPNAENGSPVPVFLLLNFGGNHTVWDDPAIALPRSPVRERFDPPEQFRGKSKSRYPVKEILARGYGIVTACYGDLDPDFHDDFKNGVHPLYDVPGPRSGEAWGAIGAWAWGLSRIMDWFEVDDRIDNRKVAVLGHSRLGKTALWAGAQDERFSIVISNNSGCTGAALARRRVGETVAMINKVFPHWFCTHYRQYNHNESLLPVDQHQLIALMAPRPVYVASATEDQGADPEGEFLSCVHAGPVYELHGLKGVGVGGMPDPETPCHSGHIGYHLRRGKHNLDVYDWHRFMDFANVHWK